MTVPDLQQRWLELTQETLPHRAGIERWTLRDDHCFQRVLLDAVCRGRWYDHIEGRPAYRHLGEERLRAALELADRLAHEEGAGRLLDELNAQSLTYRGKSAPGAPRATALPRGYTDGS